MPAFSFNSLADPSVIARLILAKLPSTATDECHLAAYICDSCGRAECVKFHTAPSGGEYLQVVRDKLPIRMGREVAGTVEDAGAQVAAFKSDDPVWAMIGANNAADQ